MSSTVSLETLKGYWQTVFDQGTIVTIQQLLDWLATRFNLEKNDARYKDIISVLLGRADNTLPSNYEVLLGKNISKAFAMNRLTVIHDKGLLPLISMPSIPPAPVYQPISNSTTSTERNVTLETLKENWQNEFGQVPKTTIKQLLDWLTTRLKLEKNEARYKDIISVLLGREDNTLPSNYEVLLGKNISKASVINRLTVIYSKGLLPLISIQSTSPAHVSKETKPKKTKPDDTKSNDTKPKSGLGTPKKLAVAGLVVGTATLAGAVGLDLIRNGSYSTTPLTQATPTATSHPPPQTDPRGYDSFFIAISPSNDDQVVVSNPAPEQSNDKQVAIIGRSEPSNDTQITRANDKIKKIAARLVGNCTVEERKSYQRQFCELLPYCPLTDITYSVTCEMNIIPNGHANDTNEVKLRDAVIAKVKRRLVRTMNKNGTTDLSEEQVFHELNQAFQFDPDKANFILELDLNKEKAVEIHKLRVDKSKVELDNIRQRKALNVQYCKETTKTVGAAGGFLAGVALKQRPETIASLKAAISAIHPVVAVTVASISIFITAWTTASQLSDEFIIEWAGPWMNDMIKKQGAAFLLQYGCNSAVYLLNYGEEETMITKIAELNEKGAYTAVETANVFNPDLYLDYIYRIAYLNYHRTKYLANESGQARIDIEVKFDEAIANLRARVDEMTGKQSEAEKTQRTQTITRPIQTEFITSDARILGAYVSQMTPSNTQGSDTDVQAIGHDQIISFSVGTEAETTTLKVVDTGSGTAYYNDLMSQFQEYRNEVDAFGKKIMQKKPTTDEERMENENAFGDMVSKFNDLHDTLYSAPSHKSLSSTEYWDLTKELRGLRRNLDTNWGEYESRFELKKGWLSRFNLFG